MELGIDDPNQDQEIIRKLSLLVLMKILENSLPNQQTFCEMFNCMQNDETPIIVINGGYSAFET
jgi:hypothetical protein